LDLLQSRCENLKPRASYAPSKKYADLLYKISHFIMAFLNELEVLMSKRTKKIPISMLSRDVLIQKKNSLLYSSI